MVSVTCGQSLTKGRDRTCNDHFVAAGFYLSKSQSLQTVLVRVFLNTRRSFALM